MISQDGFPSASASAIEGENWKWHTILYTSIWKKLDREEKNYLAVCNNMQKYRTVCKIMKIMESIKKYTEWGNYAKVCKKYA